MATNDRLCARLKNGLQTVFGGKRDTDIGTHECLPCAICGGVDENQLPVLVDADHGVACCLAAEAIVLLPLARRAVNRSDEGYRRGERKSSRPVAVSAPKCLRP